jgi:hypothetical protein
MSNSKTSLLTHLIRLALIVLILSLGLVLLAWLGWIVLPWFAFPMIIEPRVRELGRVANWSREIISAVTIIAVVTSVYFFKKLRTRNHRQRWTAISVLAGLAVAYFGLQAWLSRDHLYDSAGKPTFYWGLTPQGTIHKQSEPGLNPYTQKPLLPASAEYLTLIRSRLREPLNQVDPATHDWFDANTGWPMLWYYRSPQGQSEFYARPAIHPSYQVELQPVTVELRHQWEQAQVELKAKAAALARQDNEKRQAEAVQRAAEQQRLLEIKRAQVDVERLKAETARQEEAAHAEAERLKAETDRREQEAAAIRASAKEAALAEEQKIRDQALQAEQERQEKVAVEIRRQQEIIDRRVREAAAPVSELEWLSPVTMLAQICPNLRADGFRQDIFEDRFADRRFRYNSRVTQLLDHKRLALLETLTAGEIHLIIQANLTPESADTLRVNRGASLAGTVTAIRFIPGVTNINGIRCQVCILQLGNVTGSYHESVAQAPAKTPKPKVNRGEPLFTPMSNFRDNPPLQAVVGFTFENSVRLVFSPLRLLGSHSDRTEYSQITFVERTYPVPSPEQGGRNIVYSTGGGVVDRRYPVSSSAPICLQPYSPPPMVRANYRPPAPPMQVRVVQPVYQQRPPMLGQPSMYSPRPNRR